MGDMMLSQRVAPLFVCLIPLFSVSCSKPLHVVASAPDVPTVAVAKVTSEDLSHSLVLTAEFRPFQEIYLKRRNYRSFRMNCVSLNSAATLIRRLA